MTALGAEAVSVSRDGPVTRIRLNRADKLNSFNEALVDGLMAAVQRATSDGARLVVFQGEGKGFSGGFDLSAIDDSTDGDLLLRMVRVEELLQAVRHAPVATLALTHGPCYGAAADLVAACNWRVASMNARFRMPGPRFGLVLGTHRLSCLVGTDNARALLLREKPFGAEEALAAGFVTEIAERDSWPDVEARVLSNAAALTAETFDSIASRLVTDTRDADLAALVRSAASGSIKARIKAYLEEVAAARKPK